jgi:hypothetical protein
MKQGSGFSCIHRHRRQSGKIEYRDYVFTLEMIFSNHVDWA